MYDYRSSLHALMEKLMRQRTYWKHLTRGYLNDDLPGHAEALHRAMADLDYILGKSVDHLDPEFLAEVQQTATTKNAERYLRKQQEQADFNTMAVEGVG